MIEKRRKEIDALRAIAIISVILFHFKRDIFPLGFLGVDLFFIISGYVISLSIKNRIDQKVFTFISFYVRRIKRILPVVLFVLLFISIFSVFILLANDLQRYAQSLLSTLGFFANIYFWISGGYFGINDELKPLLHMWSLSVEEQFYLIFPLFLFLVIKFFKNKTLKLLIIFSIIIISYFLNIYFLNRGNSDPAFFLLPTRVWQFGLGAILMWLLGGLGMPVGGRRFLAAAVAGLTAGGFFFLDWLPLNQGLFLQTVSQGVVYWPSRLLGIFWGLNPVWLSVAFPLVVAFLLGVNRSLRILAVGFVVGFGAQLFYGAAMGTLQPSMLPAFTSTLWLAANGTMCLLLGLALIGTDSLEAKA